MCIINIYLFLSLYIQYLNKILNMKYVFFTLIFGNNKRMKILCKWKKLMKAFQFLSVYKYSAWNLRASVFFFFVMNKKHWKINAIQKFYFGKLKNI